jgi:hypothetical protein
MHIHLSEFFALVAEQTPSREGGRNGREMTAEFSLSASLLHRKESLTCRKILHGADGFTWYPKKVVLRIFIAFKNPSLSAVFEPANLGLMANTPLHHRERQGKTLRQGVPVSIQPTRSLRVQELCTKRAYWVNCLCSPAVRKNADWGCLGTVLRMILFWTQEWSNSNMQNTA